MTRLAFAWVIEFAILSVGAQATFAYGGEEYVPCHAVWKACLKAGRTKMDAKACVDSIKQGGKVKGVVVRDSDLAECRPSSKASGTAAQAAPPSSH